MSSSKQAAPPPPAPAPSMQETSAQAIEAQLAALPRILQAQEQYGPQFSQLSLEELEKWGPQFAEAALRLQREYAPQFAEVERGLSPELAGAQSTLANFLKETDDDEYNRLKPGLLEDVRSAQSVRGIGAISPLGSIDESVQLQRLRQSLKDRRINVALSTAGRVPISSFPQIQGQTGVGQLVQNAGPGELFGYQQGLNNFNASIFGTQANIFNTRQTNATAQRGQNFDLMGSIIGGSSKIASAAMMPACWVAAEIYGGMYEPRTVLARRYVLEIAPAWFRNFYVKHGMAIAKFISNKPVIKSMLKPLFDYFVKKGGE